MLPSSRPGGKTNFVVAKCTFLRRCCLGLCCALQTLHKILYHGSSKCLLPHENPVTK